MEKKRKADVDKVQRELAEKHREMVEEVSKNADIKFTTMRDEKNKEIALLKADLAESNHKLCPNILSKITRKRLSWTPSGLSFLKITP